MLIKIDTEDLLEVIQDAFDEIEKHNVYNPYDQRDICTTFIYTKIYQNALKEEPK